MRVLFAFLLLIATFSVARSATVVEVAASRPDLSVLVSLVEVAQLVPALNDTQGITVFAPNNASFAALPASLVNSLLANTTELQQVLLYHVIGAEVNSSQVANDVLVTSLDGTNKIRTNVYSTPSGTVVTVNGARVIDANLLASNGIIHVIDKVLLPPTTTIVEGAQANANFSTLVTVLIAANLVGVFDGNTPFTVFAPTNDAFAKIPQFYLTTLVADIPTLTKVLTYHVVSGTFFSAALYNGLNVSTVQGQAIRVAIGSSGVTLDGVSQVTAADLVQKDGVIHVIDTVLLPSFNLYELNSLSNLTFLNTLLNVSELAPIFKNDAAGPFTVFGPTNAAFEALPTSLVNTLLANTTLLAAVLKYHVVAGKVVSSGLTNDALVPTLEGPSIRVNVYSNGANTINCARITTADIGATTFTGSNGVLHVIDQVILAPTTDIVGAVVADPRFTILKTAVIAANLTGALSSSSPLTVFAPTDDAFLALGNATIDALLADKALLTSILLYHVVASTVCSAGISAGNVPTLNGATISITTQGGVKINTNTSVIQADLLQTNGVIHVIDKVLLPPTPSTTGAATTAPVSTTAASTTAVSTTAALTTAASTTAASTSGSTTGATSGSTTASSAAPTSTSSTTSSPDGNSAASVAINFLLIASTLLLLL